MSARLLYTCALVVLLAGSLPAQGNGSKVSPPSTNVPRTADPPSKPDASGPPAAPEKSTDREIDQEPVPQERRALETTRSAWLTWWYRNQDRYVRRPFATQIAHPSLPPHLLDPVWRERRREDYRDEVTGVLTELCRDRDDRVRGAAATALGRIGPSEQHGLRLLELLGDGNTVVRERALLGAAVAPDSPVTYHIFRILAGTSDADRFTGRQVDEKRFRALAALFLALREDSSLLPFVQAQIEDRGLSQRIRGLLVQALGVCGRSDAVPFLSGLATDRRQPNLLRCAAVDALGRIGDPTTADLVLRILQARDPDPEARVSAALAAGTLVSPLDQDAVRILERVLHNDGNQLVRNFLLLSLGQIGGPVAQQQLERKLERSRGDERCFAALGLGLLIRQEPASSAAQTLLQSYRQSRILEDRRTLLIALGLSAHPAALEVLSEAALEGSSPDLRLAAVEAFKALGSAEAIPVLERVVREEKDPGVVRAAARSLGLIDPVATYQFLAALRNPDRATSALRVPMLFGLGYTQDPQALPILIETVHSFGATSHEREAATWALGMIYAPEPRALTSALAFQTNFLRESPEVEALLALSPSR